MTYNAIASAAQDPDLRKRVAACFAQQIDGSEHPLILADRYIWQVVSDPTISDAYSYAVTAQTPEPGKNEAVVTDQMILDAVTTILNPAP